MAILGVDVGGTFTDFYYLDEGRLQVHKRPSTPHDPGESIIAGLVERGWRPDEVVHGSTVATNTVLTRSGARVAFVTTAGFRDLLAIGRQARPRIYELEPRREPPLVGRELSFEARERLDYQGDTLVELSDDDVRRLVREVRVKEPEAIAVCLLFSYLNPEHETRIGAALREEGFDVTLSSEVLPEPREYERASTTVLSAYVAPKMRAYLSELDGALRDQGCKSLSIVQSNGGTLSAGQAGDKAASTLLSGPAAGVAGAFAEAQRLGFERAITLDIGGTSTDVCLCPGSIPFTSEWSISDLPVRLPAVDVHTVGAGGGSVAWTDEGGALRVGPHSAGAVPGPAAYGSGGPTTVTDAHLTLGRLSESSFLGGNFAVQAGTARQALEALGIGAAEEAARGVVSVANTAISNALRLVSVERGHDPADFTLVAFGGAGPLHACELAESMGMRRVVVPRYPGVLSAMGMIWAEAMRDYSAALAVRDTQSRAKEVLAGIREQLRELTRCAKSELGKDVIIETAVDMRYEGQGYELTVPMTRIDLRELMRSFHEQHRRRYGHDSVQRKIEAITVRLRARVPKQRPEMPALPNGGKDPRTAQVEVRDVILASRQRVPVFDREALLAGNVIDGPAIVSQVDSTTLVLPGWRAEVERLGSMILERAR